MRLIIKATVNGSHVIVFGINYAINFIDWSARWRHEKNSIHLIKTVLALSESIINICYAYMQAQVGRLATLRQSAQEWRGTL